MPTAPNRAELLLSPELPPDVESEWIAVLRENGFEAEAHRQAAHRSPTGLDWLLLLSLPLQAFVAALGSEAMHDLYRGLKDRLRGRDRDVPKPMVLEDSDTGLRIILEADLPPEAFERLFEMNFEDFDSGPLHYDRYRRIWRSELDEAGD
ncbi:hypothetical protein [Glycomyces buryatensis]|uniref:Uncharacterized protein n=1 Tax=Glycomyces buryatensis TaxID=2570927 RepID=A0A4S8QF11_9ACTN|nr:hypothetical protein [Glycomyces buryatensis]THV39839.1 hypothetical protein FAB82_16655 [Glycomyces buryatensis]